MASGYTWIYYERGKGFKLDLTHVREHRSEEGFLKLLDRAQRLHRRALESRGCSLSDNRPNSTSPDKDGSS